MDKTEDKSAERVPVKLRDEIADFREMKGSGRDEEYVVGFDLAIFGSDGTTFHNW